jgi:hypothetical protein
MADRNPEKKETRNSASLGFLQTGSPILYKDEVRKT